MSVSFNKKEQHQIRKANKRSKLKESLLDSNRYKRDGEREKANHRVKKASRDKRPDDGNVRMRVIP